ncbi:MAG TPA: NADH-quinone oxidoreductase subunit M [Mycobacteriales bacterium]|nr:NADH-quinone oxidoreductase subunit M [Mycobacteriales bacterium]
MHTGFPWVTVIGVIPLVGIAWIMTLPKAREDFAKVVALVASLVAMVASIIMAFAYQLGGARFQFTQDYTWIKAFGAHYAVGVDGIALALILMTTILTPVCILASWHDAERGEDADPEAPGGRGPKLFFSLLLATETLVVGVFGSLDVFFFYVLFEAMLIPMYFLIGSFGGSRRSYAAVKFLLYSLAGGLLMLVAVIGLFVVSSHQLGTGTFDYRVLTSGKLHISHDEQVALFLGFFIAFAIKAPLWPFHTWLPDAASEAPTGTAVMLVGVLDKVGTFGFLRFCIPLFPYASKLLAPYILGLCVTGILYGALLAIGQKDLKRLIAYSSVSHFGFIALGVFAFTTQGGSGATLYMVNHGFSTGALFLVVGFLASRRGSRLVDDFGGVATVAPWLGAMVLVAGLSALALPGLSTFVSEFLVLLGTFTTHRWFAVIGTFGIVLAAVYVLWMVQRTIHGPVATAVEGFKDLSLREAWVIAPVMVVIVALGVYPKPLLDIINPSVQQTNSVVRTHDPVPSVPEQSATNSSCGQLPSAFSALPLSNSDAYASTLRLTFLDDPTCVSGK